MNWICSNCSKIFYRNFLCNTLGIIGFCRFTSGIKVYSKAWKDEKVRLLNKFLKIGLAQYSGTVGQNETVANKLSKIIEDEKVLILIKGSPQEPKCRFSAKLVNILDEYKVGDYAYIDVLENDEVRRIAKEISEWPTFPQLFVNGRFVGGCDIVESLHFDGSLKEVLNVKRVSECRS